MAYLRSRSTTLLPLLTALCLILAMAVPARAQTSTLQGEVRDSQGEALPGVTVAATSAARAAPIMATTDASGRYQLDSLPPGSYDVRFSLEGFQAIRELGVSVQNGFAVNLDAELGLARLTERVEVVGFTPLLGTEIDRDLIPATVLVLGAAELRGRGAASFADALGERLGSVSIEGATTNLFQPTLRFRGFTASPLLGLPQGIAVYQNGVRINEPFGDTVQFDLMPQFAVSQTQLSAGADPTYGLNALGGALGLSLKNGFDFTGFAAEISGGSFDRLVGTAEYGVNNGPWALYVGATRFDEEGWRVQSPSEVTQAVADVGYRKDRVDAGVTFTYADTRMNGNGAAPIELLEVDRSAVFTYPDTTENQLAFLQGRFDLAATDAWSVQATAYYRDLDRQTLNGDEAEFSVCDDDLLPAGAPANTLCQGADDDDDELRLWSDRTDDEDADGDEDGDDETAGTPLVDANNTGRFITTDDAAGDGAFNRTSTRAKGYGATVQATGRGTVGGSDHILVLGASADLADIDFSSNSEVGTLTDERTVSGSGLRAGLFGQAPDDLFNTSIDSENQYYGLYVSDTMSLTPRTHLTLSGRFNHARIEIIDRLGVSLNGDHSFSRFNPAAGLVYQLSDAASLFGRYSESNRAPTAAELSCADPEEPCRVPNAFISDPPLEQAVARSIEGGVRGRWTGAPGNLDWSASFYRTRIDDDILFIASPELIGTGYFQNAGDTQRVGLDLDLRGQINRVGWYLGYGLVEATFESPLELPGNDEVNDATTGNGALAVQPGDRLVGIPRHSVKAGIGVPLTRAFDIAVEAVAASNRIFLGDEGNDQLPLDGYGAINLRSAYRLTPEVELFVRVDNLFDAEYETFGALAELEVELEEVPNAEDPRFVGPAAPRSGFAGVRLRF